MHTKAFGVVQPLRPQDDGLVMCLIEAHALEPVHPVPTYGDKDPSIHATGNNTPREPYPIQASTPACSTFRIAELSALLHTMASRPPATEIQCASAAVHVLAVVYNRNVRP